MWYPCIINNYASVTCGFFLTSTQNPQKCYFEVQNRIPRSNGAHDSKDSKARSEQQRNSLHIKCSCINWNFVDFYSFQNSNDVWFFLGKWRNALCMGLIHVTCSAKQFSKLMWPIMTHTSSVDHNKYCPVLSLCTLTSSSRSSFTVCRLFIVVLLQNGKCDRKIWELINFVMSCHNQV